MLSMPGKIPMPRSSGYFAAIVPFLEWKERIGLLRFKIFVELLGWVNGDPETKTETDRYDEDSAHVAVFSEGDPEKILGYVRISSANSPSGLMLTGEPFFRDILPKNFTTEPLSMEVSRLCLAEEEKRGKVRVVVSELLFRSVLVFMKNNGIKVSYAIADSNDARGHSQYDLLVKRFPLFEIITSDERKPDITTYIMSLTREGLEEALARKR